jgi:predicted nucleic acid-binding protein
MLAVADNGPLNYLVWIGSAGLLSKIYGRVIVPPEVRDELLAADAPSVVRTWAGNFPPWVEVRTAETSLRDDPRWRSLDLGERAAIALATANPPCVLLIDERAGAAMARSLGLSVTGTLGLLDEAARRKLISLPDSIERLKKTSFRYPKLIVNRLLEEDSRRR